MSDQGQESGRHLEPRVARLEGGMEQVVSTLDKVVKSVDALSEKVDAKTAPNFSTMLAFAGIVLTIVGMVAAPCAWFVIHEMARQDQNLRDMDTKLQREYLLMDQTSAARHSDAVSRVEKLERWKDDQIRSDLEELRLRRMGGHP